MNILVGVTASISAYKTPDFVHQLVKRGHHVQVIITEHASQFVTPLSLETLSKHRVYCDVMTEYNKEYISHIELAKWCDCFIIAPASANMIGKLANGIADDMLSTTALAVANTKKRLLAPAMNTTMYENKAVQRNIWQLCQDGYELIEPKESLLACGDKGKGALADIDVLIQAIEKN